MSELTWESHMTERILSNSNNGIMVLLKSSHETMRHKDATIFRYVQCVPLDIVNVLTEPFSLSKVNGKNTKGLIFD